MALTIKELAIVFVIALLVFRALQPMARRFASETDLRRRRFAWYAVTAIAFLSPNALVYTVAASPLLIFMGKKDSNPAAIYLMLWYVVPPFSWRVPMVGISYLVYLSPALLLSLCILAPRAARIRSEPVPGGPSRADIAGLCLFAYLLLTAFYFVLPETAPGVLMTYTFKDGVRRVFEAFFTLYVPYFVISRSLFTYSAILDCLTSFISSAAVMAGVGLFEAGRHWLLYGEAISRLNDAVQYLVRDGHLRAMASSGQPLALASIIDLALGFWLCVQRNVDSRRTNILILLLLLGGLYATHSIGPEIGAAVIFLAFGTLRPGASPALKVIAVAGVAGIVLLQLGDASALASHIPLVSSWEQNGDYLYRVRLMDRAQEIILANPLLGDQYGLLKMQDLRQGQGIIDLVNGYAVVLLGSGVVGFFLWASFVAAGLRKASLLSREVRIHNPRLSALGVALVSCTIGILFLIMNNGSMDPMLCVLTGLSIAYARLGRPAALTVPDVSIMENQAT